MGTIRVQLFRAIRKGNIARLKEILQCQSYVNILMNEKMSLMHIACLFNQFEIVKFLKPLGLSANALNKRQETPFDIACQEGCTDIVGELINDVDVTVLRDFYLKQHSAFYIAMSRNHLHVVAHFAKKLSDITLLLNDANNDHVFKVFDFKGENVETLIYLIDVLKVDINLKRKTHEKGYVWLQFVQPNYYFSFLHFFCRNRSYRCGKLLSVLLERGVDMYLCDDTNNTPFQILAHFNARECVAFIERMTLDELWDIVLNRPSPRINPILSDPILSENFYIQHYSNFPILIKDSKTEISRRLRPELIKEKEIDTSYFSDLPLEMIVEISKCILPKTK